MLHIIQNDPEVPPGTITGHLPVPCTIHHPYLDGSLPHPEEIGALIVLGGSMSANDDHAYPFLADLKRLIRSVVAAGIPYLGICLGGQLLAAALGAEVVAHRWEEIGIGTVSLNENGCRDLLFRDLPREFTTLQWHHDSFDIPEGATLLAYSPACPHQAFRVGESAWGVQFHPEANEEIIRTWSARDESLSSGAGELLAGFKAGEESFRATVRQLTSNFLQAMKLNWYDLCPAD
jgi:GMP synthase-like glutamine amidotransferase